MQILTKIKLEENTFIVIDSSVSINGKTFVSRMQSMNRDVFCLSTSYGGKRYILGVREEEKPYVDAMVDSNIRDLMRYVGNHAERKVEFIR